MDVGKFNGCSLYAKLRVYYRLRLWAPTSTSCSVSAVAELLVLNMIAQKLENARKWKHGTQFLFPVL